MRYALVLAALAAAVPSASSAQTTGRILVNTDRSGLALQGFDPVSYFEGTAPLEGSAAITLRHRGATYRFASAANRDRFAQEPDRFAPQFGGYCGYGASRNYLAPVDPRAYTIMNGRLILQNSPEVLEAWNKDPAERLELADRNWPGLVEKKGK